MGYFKVVGRKMLIYVFGDEIRNITPEESISAAFEAALIANFCVPRAFSLHSLGMTEMTTFAF